MYFPDDVEHVDALSSRVGRWAYRIRVAVRIVRQGRRLSRI